MDPIARFRSAIHAGRLDEVRELLAADAGLANAPVFGFGGRAIAHVNRNLALLDLLLAHGADLNAKSDWWAGGWGVFEMLDPVSDAGWADALVARGATIDVFAAARLDRLDRLRELIAADPSLVHARGGDGCRPLHFAESEAAMDVLLGAGADIDARDVDHESTAAQWAVPGRADDAAARARAVRRVQWLLDRGASADVFMPAAIGDAALLAVTLSVDPNAVTARVGGKTSAPCPDAPGRHIYVYKFTEGQSPFEVARSFGHLACADVLRAHSSPKDRFLAACAVADADDARRLLAADPGIISRLTASERSALPTAAWAENAAAVRLMLDLDFDPLAAGVDSGTALHCAAWRGRADLVRLILEHPAVAPRRAELINAKESTHGSTPLGWCCHGSTNCRNPRGDYSATATLLQAAGGEAGPNRHDASDAVRAALDGIPSA